MLDNFKQQLLKDIFGKWEKIFDEYSGTSILAEWNKFINHQIANHEKFFQYNLSNMKYYPDFNRIKSNHALICWSIVKLIQHIYKLLVCSYKLIFEFIDNNLHENSNKEIKEEELKLKEMLRAIADLLASGMYEISNDLYAQVKSLPSDSALKLLECPKTIGGLIGDHMTECVVDLSETRFHKINDNENRNKYRREKMIVIMENNFNAFATKLMKLLLQSLYDATLDEINSIVQDDIDKAIQNVGNNESINFLPDIATKYFDIVSILQKIANIVIGKIITKTLEKKHEKLQKKILQQH